LHRHFPSIPLELGAIFWHNKANACKLIAAVICRRPPFVLSKSTLARPKSPSPPESQLMTGLFALAPNFWPYACIAIGILAAIAIGEKRC
jgi:hypothetical protein